MYMSLYDFSEALIYSEINIKIMACQIIQCVLCWINYLINHLWIDNNQIL